MLRKISSSVVVGILAGLFAAGCATNRNADSDSSADHGVMCPACKSVWTFDTVGQGSKVQRLAANSEMTCPECDAMAMAYMKDGQKVLHNCETCKVTPTVVKPSKSLTPVKGPRT